MRTRLVLKTSSWLLFLLLVFPVAPAVQRPLSETSHEMSDLILLHNQVRMSSRSCGGKRMQAAAALSWNSKLSAAARKHAKDLSDKQFMSHIGSDKSTFSERAKAKGYKVSFLAENIGQGYNSANTIFAKWLNSAPHCRNIMNRNYRDIGAAQIGDSWVVMYGSE